MTQKQIDDAQVREAAYHIWVSEGMPHGRDQQHWLAALEALKQSEPKPKPKAKRNADAKSAKTAKATPKAKAEAKPTRKSRAKAAIKKT